MNSSLESQLRAKLKPLIHDKRFLRGAVLMAYACKSNGEPQRAESFGFDIALLIINNILHITATPNDLMQSNVGAEAIEAALNTSLELASEGLLKEIPVYGDACPYLQQPSLQHDQLTKQLTERFNEHRRALQSVINLTESSKAFLITTFWTSEVKRRLKSHNLLLERSAGGIKVIIMRSEPNQEIRFVETVTPDMFDDESHNQLAIIINRFKTNYPNISYSE